ncbi:MAG TPA: hypothetical protein VMV62_00295 [Candidatus Paceibacterota bacterium]|nr:hypothetical protein [Candidatus Paceibacterota bacterium]
MKTTSLAIGIALLVGIVIGIIADPYLPASLNNSQKNYQAGFDAAKTLVASSSVGAMFNTPADARTLSGTVTAIQGDTLTLRVGMTDPFGDPALANRTVTVDASTTIVRLSVQPGSPVPATGKGAIPTPPLFTQTPVSLSGIIVGDPLTVTAAENIATVKEFTATEIQIQAQALSSVSSTVAK